MGALPHATNIQRREQAKNRPGLVPRYIFKQCPSKTLRGLTTTQTDTVYRGTRHTHSQPAWHEARPTHDTIYSLLTIIQQHWTVLDSPTYVVFLDYSTAYPSVHRGSLAVLLHQFKIVGKMWHHLCNHFKSVKLRVLHPGIAPHQTVQILCGLPEGSLLQSFTRVSTCGSVVFYMSMTCAFSPP